jgi:hypothetical protein
MNGKHEGIKEGIETVVEFIQEIKKIQKKSRNSRQKKDQKRHIFYRGHSDKDYDLEPSLFRKITKKGKNKSIYSKKEDILYRELYMSEYKEFIHDKYTLDKLVRMQHYSLPTRLLDLTTNPLIALYFACKSSTDKQKSVGEVILFFIKDKYVKYYDSDTASYIANLARLSHKEKGYIKSAKKRKKRRKFSMKKLLHFIKQEKSYFEPKFKKKDLKKIICIKGIRNNVRISSQSGVFLLFGLDAILDKNGNENIQIQRIKIRDKKKILDELDLLNINESTVFPDIESSARYISYKNKVK